MKRGRSSTVQTFSLGTRQIRIQEMRMDASFYAQDAINARILIESAENAGVEICPVNDFCDDIFLRPRFKREYVTHNDGIPFLAPMDIFMFPLKPRKFVVNPPSGMKVEPGWILITRSGTVGRCRISDLAISECVPSDDFVLLVPRNRAALGYVYAYLRTWIGQAFLSKNQYGAAVKHIEPHQVATIPVPRIRKLEGRISNKILKAIELISQAQSMLQEAEEKLHRALDLPAIEEHQAVYLGESGETTNCFQVRVSELDFRLDASFHTPVVRMITNTLRGKQKQGEFDLVKVGDIAEVFDLPTYKRVYVGLENGMPILSGAHLKQIEPLDLKHISPESFASRGVSNLQDYVIKEGWLLVTERGTIGVTAYVSKAWDGWLASHNILRIVPRDIRSGYLLAILNSDYSQLQMKSKELGAVVEVLDPTDMRNILIPKPRDEVLEEMIHNLVIQAYRKRDAANRSVKQAVDLLEKGIREASTRKSLRVQGTAKAT